MPQHEEALERQRPAVQGEESNRVSPEPELEFQHFGGGGGPVNYSGSAVSLSSDLPDPSERDSGFANNSHQHQSNPAQAGGPFGHGQNVSGAPAGASASAHHISGEAAGTSAGGFGGGADQAGTVFHQTSAGPQTSENPSDGTVPVQAEPVIDGSEGEPANGQIPSIFNLGFSTGWLFNIKGTRLHACFLTKLTSSAPLSGSFLTDLKVGVGFKLGTDVGSSPLIPSYAKGPGSIQSYELTVHNTSLLYEKGHVRPELLNRLANPLSYRFPTAFPNPKVIFSSFSTGRPFTLPCWLVNQPFERTRILGTIYAENSYLPWFSKNKQILVSLKHSPESVTKPLFERVFHGRFLFLTSCEGQLVSKPSLLGPHLFLNEEQSTASLPRIPENPYSVDIGKPLPAKSGLLPEDYRYLQDQFNAERAFVQKEVSSKTQILLSKLHTIQFSGKEQFDQLQRRTKAFEENAFRHNQKLLNAINTGREEQSDCCETHTGLLKDNQDTLSNVQEKLDNSKNFLPEALIGSGVFVFFRSLYLFLCSFFGGAFIALVLGLTISFFYIIADYYLVYYYTQVKDKKLRHILYGIAYIVRIVSSGGVLGAVFLCYTHSFITGRKLPLLNFFKKLPIPINGSDSPVIESQKVSLFGDALVHFIGVKVGPILKQGLVVVSGYYTAKKLLAVYNNANLFLIIYGSSFTFAFCRIQISTCYSTLDEINSRQAKGKLEETQLRGWEKLPFLNKDFKFKETLFEAFLITSGCRTYQLIGQGLQDLHKTFKENEIKAEEKEKKTKS